MKDASDITQNSAVLDVEGLPTGSVLSPMKSLTEGEKEFLTSWETPLSPWGGFNVPGGMSVEMDSEIQCKVFTFDRQEGWARSLVSRTLWLRDCNIEAEIKPLSTEAVPNADRPQCSQALVGLIFRRQTSRQYYQFGLEGRERVVVYRRKNNEWYLLAEKKVNIPTEYLKLEVELDGDGMRCRCNALDVDFLCTDVTYKMGRVGVRSLGKASVRSLRIIQKRSQKARNNKRRRVFMPCSLQYCSEKVPDPVLKETIDLKELDGNPIFKDFVRPDRYDMLLEKDECLQAVTESGKCLWEYPHSLSQIVFSKYHGEEGRLIYGFAGSRRKKLRKDVAGRRREEIISDEIVVLSGATGKEISRARIPEMLPTTRRTDFSPTSGRLSSSEGTDIVLREWRSDKGDGGTNLWAYDKDLNLLWTNEQTGAWYGHHYALALEDVDGDGRDELLAGGVLYDCRGNIIWEHDRSEEVLNTVGGKHYDAVTLLESTEESEDRSKPHPIAFLMAGSAGVYVVDALSGRTRAKHHIGHAQGQARRGIDQRTSCKVRDDIPDEQVLVTTRWGNFGIRALFSARGELLWSIQPDYIPNAVHLRWGGLSPEVFLISSTPGALGFYDGYGNRIKKLPMLEKFWNGSEDPRKVGIGIIRWGAEDTDLLAVRDEGKIHIFEPDR